jgi:hypothetical protein
MEYRHPPLYIVILSSIHSGARGESKKQRAYEESPCTDIELIGNL